MNKCNNKKIRDKKHTKLTKTLMKIKLIENITTQNINKIIVSVLLYTGNYLLLCNLHMLLSKATCTAFKVYI